MKIKELIEKLKEFDEELEVFCFDKDYIEEFPIIFVDSTDVIMDKICVIIAFSEQI
jgi:hypothetical protein